MDIPPRMLAEFDQCWTAGTHSLHGLTEAYKTARTEDRAQHLPEAVSIVSLAAHLGETWSTDELASILACAVVLLSHDF